MSGRNNSVSAGGFNLVDGNNDRVIGGSNNIIEGDNDFINGGNHITIIGSHITVWGSGCNGMTLNIEYENCGAGKLFLCSPNNYGPNADYSKCKPISILL